MTDFQAIVLGIVQGITEWLPISSTAHLNIVPDLLKWRFDDKVYAPFTAVIQLGTTLAALIYFRKDIVGILLNRKGAPGQDVGADRRLLLPIAVGTLPVVIAGFGLKKHIETDFRSMYVIAIAEIVFAILLLVADRLGKRNVGMEQVSVKDGLMVGLGQMMAIIPGVSRSGGTLTAAFSIGLDRPTAARFSFLLSLPAVTLAGLYELVKSRHEIAALHMTRYLVESTAVSFVVGLLTIGWLINFLKNHNTMSFVIYRIILGVALLILLGLKIISPMVHG